MFDGKANILHLNPEPGRRIIAVSDIHGNLPYFRGLLEKTGFCREDILIIDGDFLEKGPQSLATLRFVMELCAAGNAYAIAGNCDGWAEMFRMPEEGCARTIKYIQYRRSGVLWDMSLECGIDPMNIGDFRQFGDRLLRNFPDEMAFLARLYHAAETPHYIFAHAAVKPGVPLDEQTPSDFIHCNAFMSQGLSFDKWVIVGHWPVMLYGEDIVSANPVIDRENRIISIDGGCVLKDDGQLNALIIPYEGSEDFETVYYDPFPVATVLDEQSASDRSYYIRWGDSTVRVLRRGEEFSHCRHVRTGYEMDILTKYLFTDDDETGCNDCTDYRLPLRKGDTVGVVETTSRGYFVKHNGVSGWYYGRLDGTPSPDPA